MSGIYLKNRFEEFEDIEVLDRLSIIVDGVEMHGNCCKDFDSLGLEKSSKVTVYDKNTNLYFDVENEYINAIRLGELLRISFDYILTKLKNYVGGSYDD